MNKIICDVCGTDYPETAAQCPICGCSSAGAKAAARNNSADTENRTSTRVKGGRYSKANVRKRLKDSQIPYDPVVRPNPEPEYDDDDHVEDEMGDEGSNRGLIIVVIILLLAIAAVSAYIAISIFGVGKTNNSGNIHKPNSNQTAPTTTQPTDPIVTTDPTDPTVTTDPTELEVPCTDLELSDVDFVLSELGETKQLEVTVVPADTTEEVIFRSTDEEVVTVDETGKITYVAPGEASIIITCGAIEKECPVVCSDVNEDGEFTLKLKTKDFTLKAVGATYQLYSGSVDAGDITWTTDNDEVVTIKKGVVTAVGEGRTRVYGEYEDQKVSCWVSVTLPAEEVPTDPDNTTDPDDTEEPDVTEPEENHTYAIRINGKKPNYGTEKAAEVTMKVGEELTLKVVNENGTRVDAEWTASKNGIVSIGSNTVTGEKTGTVILTVVIDGQKLTCKFIVK